MIACNAAVVYIWTGRLVHLQPVTLLHIRMQCHTTIHTAWWTVTLLQWYTSTSVNKMSIKYTRWIQLLREA